VSDVVGLVVRENRLHGAVARRSFGRTRVLGAFSLDIEESPGAALATKLRELGVRARRVHVGITRRRAVVKAIELPAVAGANIRQMVAFELERHLPFPATDAIFDFQVLDQTPGRPVRVLLVACDRRVFERIAEPLREARLVPRLLDVAIHSLATLDGSHPGLPPDALRVLMAVEDRGAEVAITRGGRLCASRTFALPTEPADRIRALGGELRRTIGGLDPEDRRRVFGVTVTGEVPQPTSEWCDFPVHEELALPSGPDAPGGDPAELAAVAMALRVPRKGSLRTNLIPEEALPRPFPWPVAATAALGLLALLLGLAIPGVTALHRERALSALTERVERRGPEVKAVEQLVTSLERARRELEILKGFEAQHTRPLAVLRELTELLPADVWLTNLTIDKNGVELAGFAAAASGLIPLLEGSPTLERAEFTSPVTKGRDKDQFRLKASWERPPLPPSTAAASDGKKPPRTAGKPPRPSSGKASRPSAGENPAAAAGAATAD
jgi:general secretion pathway protein L